MAAKMVIVGLVGAALTSAVGCASRSSEVAAAYVSPVQYQSHSCSQLAAESQRINSRAARLSGQQDDRRSRDNLATAAAIVVFWPAAFLVGGDNAQTGEIARLKGESDAIGQAAVPKNCGTRRI